MRQKPYLSRASVTEDDHVFKVWCGSYMFCMYIYIAGWSWLDMHTTDLNMYFQVILVTKTYIDSGLRPLLHMLGWECGRVHASWLFLLVSIEEGALMSITLAHRHIGHRVGVVIDSAPKCWAAPNSVNEIIFHKMCAFKVKPSSPFGLMGYWVVDDKNPGHSMHSMLPLRQGSLANYYVYLGWLPWLGPAWWVHGQRLWVFGWLCLLGGERERIRDLKRKAWGVGGRSY